MLEFTDMPERPRLLIADENPKARLALSQALSKRFQIVDLAHDADEALALAVYHQPDIALLDVHMRHGGGLRATREIARFCPDTAICALSTDELEHEVLDILLAGAMAYTPKNVAPDELEETLRQSLRAHSLLQSQLVPA